MNAPFQSLNREYDREHRVTDEGRKSLPDTQNAGSHAIMGAPVQVAQVGASNFRIPLNLVRENGELERLETAVTGTVRLDAGVRGINMSRIMRAFYEFKDEKITLASLEPILKRILREVHSEEGHIRLDFRYPLLLKSLRSGLEGYQYYDAAYEGRLNGEGLRNRMHFDFVYSSACPGSADLAEHARSERRAYAIPHSQRSRARISVELSPGASFNLERLHASCVNALKTEVEVMVRREDEQAFAELNGAYPKFVEDAARLLFEELDPVEEIRDFRAVCSHLESLHAHDAVAVITKGVENGFSGEFENFRDLVC